MNTSNENHSFPIEEKSERGYIVTIGRDRFRVIIRYFRHRTHVNSGKGAPPGQPALGGGGQAGRAVYADFDPALASWAQ